MYFFYKSLSIAYWSKYKYTFNEQVQQNSDTILIPIIRNWWTDKIIITCKISFKYQPIVTYQGAWNFTFQSIPVKFLYNIWHPHFVVLTDMIKDTARPGYWIPDEQIKNCYVCEELFGPKLRIHHCRACGQGICEGCSPNKRPVPLRGWDYPVRICRKCENKRDRLWI